MSAITDNYKLVKADENDYYDVNIVNDNLDKVDAALLNNSTFLTATGTATTIVLIMPTILVNGYSKTFIASANNSGTATTINGKPLYKPGTTTSPNLIAEKAYTVWYNKTNSCFFLKASAEGTTIASHVLAGDTFSNDVDIGLVGTMTSKVAATYTPSTVNQTIAAGQYLGGNQTILGDSDLVSANIKSGTNIFGVAGSGTVVDTSDAVLDTSYLVTGYSGYDDGVKKDGTMINRSTENHHQPSLSEAVSDANGYGAYIMPPAGYYDGSSWVRSLQPDLLASNIISGKSIFGVRGSASIGSLGGRKFKSGTITTVNLGNNNYGFYISSLGLDFTPSTIATNLSTTQVGPYYTAVVSLWNTISGNFTMSYDNQYIRYNGADSVIVLADVINYSLIGYQVQWYAWE